MLKLLLIDDQPRELDGMKGMLKWDELGIEIVGATTSGRQAIELAGQLMADIIITDVVMPDMDGIQLIREMKKRYPHVHCICISGFDEFKLVSQALNSGASGYVLKPILTSEIQATLMRIIADIRQRSPFGTSETDIALAYLCANAENWFSKVSPQLLQTSVIAGIGLIPEGIQPLATITLAAHKQVWLAAADAQLPPDVPFAGPLPLCDIQQPLLFLINKYSPASGDDEPDAVNIIIENIRKHCCEPMENETILKGVYLSRSYANVLFKNKTGITIHRYIMQERLKCAMQMLLDQPETKVTTVALQCGFSDASHLTNSMHKLFGITPEKYRRRNGKL